MSSTIMIVAPCFGSPYILKGKVGKCQLSLLNKIVGGSIQGMDLSSPLVHSLFMKENEKWHSFQKLLVNLQIKNCEGDIYVNENGMYECNPNMAMSSKRSGRPIFGDLCIQMKLSEYHKTGIENLVCFDDHEHYYAVMEEEEEEEEEEVVVVKKKIIKKSSK